MAVSASGVRWTNHGLLKSCLFLKRSGTPRRPTGDGTSGGVREIGHNLFRPLRAGGDSAALSRLGATVHGVAQCQLGFDPLAKLAPGESLGRLRRAVVKDAHHDNDVGMHV